MKSALSLGIAFIITVAVTAAWVENLPASPAATRPANALFSRDNLVAWCIVPYDGKQRTPAQRAEMLDHIGLHKFAYDWRAKQLPGFDSELDELAKHKIELTGVWFPDTLNADAKFILDCLAKHHVHTQLWVASWAKDGGDQDAKVNAAAQRMRPIAEAAGKIGCTLGLYNHGGWFGEPENQIAIIQKLKQQKITNVGIVYCLHHGLGDLERFPELFGKMLPYLIAVNINGTSKVPPGSGEPVVPVGWGKLDVSLLKVIRDSGYSGPIGIINESDEDAEGRLLDNIDGLNWLLPQLDGKAPGEKPKLRIWHAPRE